jgi:hypothetical protein
MPLEDETAVFEDGGFGESNNPTDLGIQEIRRLGHTVGTVVSVGTARADALYGTGILGRIKMMSDKATNPENVHARVEERADREDFDYFRLNAPGFLEVDLDEWKPKSGARTLEKIRRRFNEWLRDPQNDEDLQDCAKALVRQRRARAMDRDQWQHFAIGAVYTCLGCMEVTPCRAEFKNKASFRSHLLGHHGLARDGLTADQIPDNVLKTCMARFQYRSPL